MTNTDRKKPTEATRFRALWDFVFLSGGESIGKIAGFLAFAYLARTLDSASYGAVEIAVAMLAIFSLFIDFGFGQIGAREVSQSPEKADHWAALIPGARLMFTLLCIPLMFLLAVFMELPEKDTQLIWIVSFALFGMVWNQVWLLQGLEKMRWISFNQALRMIVFAVGVMLFVNSNNDLLNVGVVQLGAAIGMTAFLLFLQQRAGVAIRLSFRFQEITRLIKRASSIGLGQTVWALNQYVSIVMVAYLAGAVAGAWFAAAHRIVNALTSYSLVYHFNLFPTTSARLKQSDAAYQELVQSSTRVTAWAGVAVALTGTLLAETVCVLVYGPQFDAAGLSMAVLVWSIPITIMSGHARFALVASEKQRYVLTAQSLGAVTTIVLGAVLIPVFGPVGASCSMILSHTVVWTVVHHFMCKEVSIIPAMNVMVKPILVAGFSLAVAFAADFSAIGIGSSLGLFVLIGLLLDRHLLAAARTLSEIKSQNRQVDGRETQLES